MHQPSIPASRAAEAARIAAAVAKHQHLITVLPGPSMAPPPPRKHPKRRARPAAKQASAKQIERQQRLDQIVPMFDQGNTIRAIAKTLGFGHPLISDHLAMAGRNPTANRCKTLPPDQLEKLREMAADRYSCRYAAQILGIREDYARKVARRNGIRFAGSKV